MSLASERLGELGDSSVSVVGRRGEPALQWRQALVEGRAGGQASEGSGPREARKLNPWGMGQGAVAGVTGLSREGGAGGGEAPVLLRCHEEAQDLGGGLWSRKASSHISWGAAGRRRRGRQGTP